MTVTEAPLLGIHALIGMDIINLGDFAVTNNKGKTSFTFRIPSKADIDFVNETKEPNKSSKIGRNTTCACGSGNKYKRCCGK